MRQNKMPSLLVPPRYLVSVVEEKFLADSQRMKREQANANEATNVEQLGLQVGPLDAVVDELHAVAEARRIYCHIRSNGVKDADPLSIVRPAARVGLFGRDRLSNFLSNKISFCSMLSGEDTQPMSSRASNYAADASYNLGLDVLAATAPEYTSGRPTGARHVRSDEQARASQLRSPDALVHRVKDRKGFVTDVAFLVQRCGNRGRLLAPGRTAATTLTVLPISNGAHRPAVAVQNVLGRETLSAGDVVSSNDSTKSGRAFMRRFAVACAKRRVVRIATTRMKVWRKDDRTSDSTSAKTIEICRSVYAACVQQENTAQCANEVVFYQQRVMKRRHRFEVFDAAALGSPARKRGAHRLQVSSHSVTTRSSKNSMEGPACGSVGAQRVRVGMPLPETRCLSNWSHVTGRRPVSRGSIPHSAGSVGSPAVHRATKDPPSHIWRTGAVMEMPSVCDATLQFSDGSSAEYNGEARPTRQLHHRGSSGDACLHVCHGLAVAGCPALNQLDDVPGTRLGLSPVVQHLENNPEYHW